MKIYKSLVNARKELSEKDIKKSGYNSFSKFHYYELADFIPELIIIFENNDIISQFNLFEDMAVLKLISIEDGSFMEFQSKIAEDISSIKNPIQKIGATHTYLKKYLYFNALELTDGDEIEACADKEVTTQKQKPKNDDLKKARDEFIEISNQYSELNNMDIGLISKKYELNKESNASQFENATKDLKQKIAANEIAEIGQI